MMKAHSRRRFIQELALFAAVLPPRSAPSRRQAPRVRRIGFLIGEAWSMIAAFEGELQRLGYGDPARLVVEKRVSWSNTSDLSAQAAELGRMDLELIVAAALPQALAVRAVNPDMPMVIGTCPGFVSNGFAKTLERPGGIYTGMDELPAGVTDRRLRLLTTVVPKIARIGLLATTPGRGGHEAQLAEAEQTARALGLTVKAYRAASLRELEAALTGMAADRMEGFVNFQGALTLSNQPLIVDFAVRRRLPAVYQSPLFPQSGGLMSWAPDQDEQFRMAARYVDQILEGAMPGDLPIRHPDPYFLTLNQTAATAIGLELPPTLISQARTVLP